MFTATKVFKGEMAHILDSSYMKCCQNFHGHSVKIEVEITSATLNDDGMVMDFKKLKEIAGRLIDPMDHSVLISKQTIDGFIEKYGKDVVRDMYPGLLIVDYNPTAENIVKDLYWKISKSLEGHATLNTVTYYETESAWVKYSGHFN